MAITTLDGALAGMQTVKPFIKAASATLVAGRPHTWWGLAGAPGAGSYDSTLNGAALVGNAVAGQIPRANPGSGNSYLARFAAAATQAGMLMLCDRLWQNRPAITSGAQAITFPSMAAVLRDNAGTANGDGWQVGMEFSTANTAGTPLAPITYTNQAGTGSRTCNLIDAISATSAIGAFHRYDLQAGDTGIRSIQSINLASGLTTAVINLVLYRVLATLELPGNLIPNAIDALTSGFPRIFDNSVPFLIFVPNTTTASVVSGSYAETQG